jgi:uncharacterized protein YydD (DUF2326 family)
MKLSKIYSNRDDIFKPIRFNEGFNVIFGKVTKPKESDKDSHNLGKTLLIHLIDFLLLKELRKEQFLAMHKKLFKEYEFFLEIRLNSGKYLTIKRSAHNNTKICLKLHDEPNQNFTSLLDHGWSEYMIQIRKAVERVNELLDLNSISPWTYKTGVSYFLRTQDDYLDVFQISKFTQSEHANWKPYLAKVLGFDDTTLNEKYELDGQIETAEEYKKEREKRLTTKSSEYDKLKGAIEIKKAEAKEISEKVNRFDFCENELKINHDLVEQIESEIAFLNNEIYNIKYELEKIKSSLEKKIDFDFDEIKLIFEEVKVYFNKELSHDYKELVDFNNKVLSERKAHLSERRGVLQKEQSKVTNKLKELNVQREDMLSAIRNEDTFKKYKTFQGELVKQEAEIIRLQAELDSLDSVAVIDKEIEGLEEEKRVLVGKIDKLIKSGNELYSEIRGSFARIVKEVLSLLALLSIRLNTAGNLEFEANIIKDEKTLIATSEGKGTSYRKLLCAAFDLAVLKGHYKESFFKFVYHDGVLEGLDNRKKNNYIALVKRFCDEYGLQYILTAIEADLPRDENDAKILFSTEETIRVLSDEGQGGRLFNLPRF